MLLIGSGTNPNASAGPFTGPSTFSEGNVMSSISSFTTSDGLENQILWTAYNINGGDNPTIQCNTANTVNPGPSKDYAGCYYVEITGANTLDQVAQSGQINYSGSTLTSPTITTTQPNEVIVCIASKSNGDGGFTSAGSGWNGLAFGSQGIEYKVVSAIGSYSCSMNLLVNNSVSDFAIAIASFYKGSGSPPTTSPCDVNKDGFTNVADVQGEVIQALGSAPCANDINQDGVCNVIDVQRVVNAALGGSCVVSP